MIHLSRHVAFQSVGSRIGPVFGMGCACILERSPQLFAHRSRDWIRVSCCTLASQKLTHVDSSDVEHQNVQDSNHANKNCKHRLTHVGETHGFSKVGSSSFRVAAVAAGMLGIGWMLGGGANPKSVNDPTQHDSAPSSLDKASNATGDTCNIQVYTAAEGDHLAENASDSAAEGAVPALRGWCPASDEVFDSTDNLIVIFFDDLRHAYKQSSVIEAFRTTLEENRRRGLIPQDITVCYSFRYSN